MAITGSITSRTITALLMSVAIFLIAILLPKVLISKEILRLVTTQGLELILALVAITALGRGKFASYGFCLPLVRQQGKRWIWLILAAPLLGVAATLAILILGGKGNPVVKGLTFPQIIIFVWISSSIVEEIFTRGFLQGHLSILSGRYFKLLFLRIELPVMISALFFMCMHLVLLLAGIDAVTILVVLCFTFSLGLMAGHLRSRTGSLLPAIAAHMLANIGGMIGGVIFALVSFLLTGKLPNP